VTGQAKNRSSKRKRVYRQKERKPTHFALIWSFNLPNRLRAFRKRSYSASLPEVYSIFLLERGNHCEQFLGGGHSGLSVTNALIKRGTVFRGEAGKNTLKINVPEKRDLGRGDGWSSSSGGDLCRSPSKFGSGERYLGRITLSDGREFKRPKGST